MDTTENIATQAGNQGFGLFVPADVLSDLNAEFLDVDKCQSWVMEKLHMDNKSRCPGCNSEIPEHLMHSFWDCKRIKCAGCGKYFTALTDTFLSGCHFNFREIMFLAFLLALGVSDKQIAATLKKSVENVRLWKHRFEALNQAKKISGV